MAADRNNLTPSMEDYLETIQGLICAKGAARGRDIAAKLGVRSSSVSNALHAMAERGLVNYAPYELVTLTDAGERIAAEIRRKHAALSSFFTDVLGLDEQIAERNACRIEHDIDDGALERLACLVEFISSRADTTSELWLRDFRAFCLLRGDSAKTE